MPPNYTNVNKKLFSLQLSMTSSLLFLSKVAKSCILRNSCFSEILGTVLGTQKLVIRLVLPLMNLLTRVKRDAENWVPPILHEAAAADSSKPFDIENKNAFRDSEYSRSAATTAKENLNRFQEAKATIFVFVVKRINLYIVSSRESSSMY